LKHQISSELDHQGQPVPYIIYTRIFGTDNKVLLLKDFKCALWSEKYILI